MTEPKRTPSFGASPVIQNRPGAVRASGHRFNKACDSCHISKVRCMPDPQSPVGTCKRCSKNGTPCVFSPVGPRRRPVRTKNDRIAELERRVKDMQIKLEKQVDKRSGTVAQPEASDLESVSSGEATEPGPTSASAADTGLNSGYPEESSSIVSTTAAESRTSTSARTKSALNAVMVDGSRPKHGDEHDTPLKTSTLPTSASKPGLAAAKESDVVDRGLLTESEADQLVHEFRSALSGKYLGISLPKATSNSQLRRSRPAFWLSILCAASAGSSELFHLAPVLFSQLKTILDSRVTIGSEPDLDALQALMGWAIFHNNPVFPLGEEVVEIYSLAIKMTVSMAEVSRLHSLSEDIPILDDDVSEGDIQLSRELLHWYWASFFLCFKRRQSTMLSETHLVDASLRILRTTSDQNDARLIQWIKLVQIAADALFALQRGHTQRAGGLSDDARDEILESFEKHRKQWLVDCPFHLVDEPLMLEYHSFVIIISEVVYPAGVADFKQRSYGLPSLLNTGEGPAPDRNFFASYKIHYTRKSITAAHACLDIATVPAKSDEINADLSSCTDLLRRCSCFLHSRIFYALRLLLSVAHEAWRTKRYDVISVDTLRIDYYITALRDRLETASEKGRYRVPYLWLNALQAKIEPWWQALRRLLEGDGHDVASAAAETPTSSSKAVSPTQRANSAPLDFEHPAASFNSTSLDLPSSPLLPEVTSDLFAYDPFASDPLCAVLSYNGIFDPTATDSGLLTTIPGENCDFGLLPTTVQERGLTNPLREQIYKPPHGAAFDFVDGNIGDHGKDVNEIDHFTFNWGNLSELLPGPEWFFTPLPPYLHDSELADQEDSWVISS